MFENPFTVLGLLDGAPAAEAKRAFRRLAMEWHPDRNPSAEAEERFKQIRLAYDLIIDPERLAEWTAANEDGRADESDEADDDGREAQTVEYEVELSLEQAASGCERTILVRDSTACEGCAGSGKVEFPRSFACGRCGGCGRLRDRQRTITCPACAGRGFVRVAACPACAGSGERIREVDLRVRIPAGVRSGETVRAHRHNAGRGDTDVALKVTVVPHPLFELDGDDLCCTVPASILALIAGSEIEIPTLAGTLRVAFTPFDGAIAEHRIVGQGFPKPHAKGFGDLRVRLEPVFPQHLDAETRQQLGGLDAAIGVRSKGWPEDFKRWQASLLKRRRTSQR